MDEYVETINKLTQYDPLWVTWDYETLVLENMREHFTKPSRMIFLHQWGQVVQKLIKPFPEYEGVLKHRISIFDIEISAFIYAIDALSFNIVTVGMLDIKRPVPIAWGLRTMQKIKTLFLSEQVEWYIATCFVADGVHIFPKGIIDDKLTSEINRYIIDISKDKASEDAICMLKLQSGSPLTTEREKECKRNLDMLSATVKRADDFLKKIDKSLKSIEEALWRKE